MTKLTLDMNTFKALASDTRLDILRALDGKKMNLNDICRATNLNKATLHEHLTKLNEAGLIKKNEREGHKWVYYKLTWKGEGLLHPENTKIVVMFSITFISLLLAFMLIVSFLQPITVGMAETVGDTTYLYKVEENGIPLFERSYNFNFLGEVDAKEKTVGNITTELQKMASPRNSIGANYADEDIVWFKSADSELTLSEDASLCKSESKSVEPFSISAGSCYLPVENSQRMLNYSKLLAITDTNNSYYNESSNTTDKKDTNETLKGSNGENNTANESLLEFDYYEDFLGYYPEVPKMFAIVKDSTLLYLAVVCLIFFCSLFTFSSWRLWVNKKPKL